MQNTYKIGGLVITRDSRVVTLNNAPVRLSFSEHALILVLAESRRYMHQEEILKLMYGNDPATPEPKIIDVFICKIRKKFRAASPVGQYIESVPGSGYRVRNAPALLSVA